MRVPIRKAGEFTRIVPDPYLTVGKFNELNKKLKQLKVLLPQAVSEVKRLAEMGDFSENAAYQMAKGRLRGLNQHIFDLEEQLKLSIIIKPGHNKNKIQLGSRATVKMAGRQKTYLILGSSEIDVKNNIISHNSPIGSALMGKKAGDSVKIQLAGSEVEFKIIKIV
ncbi:GreA/GreB family elongation factor [Patescibacteria group bacterium]|nr:GreA/GreB family elongation factor [Patescibacteria group bacterium]